MARPRATSLRTNSGVTKGGIDAPKLSPSARRASASSSARSPPEILAVRDIHHLLGDDAGAGELELRDELSPSPRARSSLCAEAAILAAHRWRRQRRCMDLTCRRRGTTRRPLSAISRRRHAHIVMALRRGIDFAASRERPGRDLRRGNILGGDRLVHRQAPVFRGRWRWGSMPSLSLRRHDPDQVQRVSARASR